MISKVICMAQVDEARRARVCRSGSLRTAPAWDPISFYAHRRYNQRYRQLRSHSSNHYAIRDPFIEYFNKIIIRLVLCVQYGYKITIQMSFSSCKNLLKTCLKSIERGSENINAGYRHVPDAYTLRKYVQIYSFTYSI